MCDDDIHQGRVDVSRTGAALGVVMLAAASPGGRDAEARPVVETEVEVTTPDGQADAVLFHPEGSDRWPAVLVWPDALGLRPVFRDLGRRLAADGYVVLVPNPYYRLRPAPVVEGSFDFNTPEDRDRLMSLMGSVTREFTDMDAAAHLAFLDAQPQTDTSKLAGVQGYCMGGALSFRTAAVAPGRIGAVVSFHGGRLATDKPSSPHLLIPQTRAEYLVAVADNDDQADPAAKDTLRAAFDEAGRPASVEVYEGAAHGWTVPGSEVYDEAAAEKAWAELLALYERALR